MDADKLAEAIAMLRAWATNEGGQPSVEEALAVCDAAARHLDASFEALVEDHEEAQVTLAGIERLLRLGCDIRYEMDGTFTVDPHINYPMQVAPTLADAVQAAIEEMDRG